MGNRGTGAGGAKTSTKGHAFEDTVNVLNILLGIEGVTTTSELQGGRSQYYNILLNGHNYGCFTRGHGFYKIFSYPHKLGGQKIVQGIISSPMCPDAVIFSEAKGVAIIIEKKFQSGSGSVDEKLQTCDYKKHYLSKLFDTHFGKEIDLYYVYVLNDFFNAIKYNDVKEYILFRGCYYFHDDALDELKDFIQSKII